MNSLYHGLLQFNLVKDINPTGTGIYSPIDTDFCQLDNGIVFIGDDGMDTTGEELWISDGTNEGTYLLKDIKEGSSDSNIDRMYEFGNLVVFFADDGINGYEMWRTDGTEDGTFMLKDINPEGNGRNTINMGQVTATFDGNFYFLANSGSDEGFAELWKTDGTTEGTLFVKDPITTSANNSDRVNALTVFNDELYFIARGLWKTDGTTEGTFEVLDSPEFPYSMTRMYTFNGYLFPILDGAGDLIIYRSNGTDEEPIVLLDAEGSFAYPQHFTEYDGKHWFVRNGSLYETDGTPEGTFVSNSPENMNFTTSINGHFVFQGQLYALAGNTDLGYIGLHKLNEAGWEFVVRTSFSGYKFFYDIGENGLLYHIGYDVDLGTGVMETNGVPGESLYLFADGDDDYTVRNVVAFDNLIIQSNNANSLARELYAYETTSIPLAIFSTANNPSCFGNADGSISIDISGGQGPFDVSWSTGDEGNELADLTVGSYSYTVTDATGASSSETVELSEPLPVVIGSALTTPEINEQANGTAEIVVSGGTGTYTYLWSTGGIDAQISNLDSGSYSVTVTDANGCEITESLTVEFQTSTGDIVQNKINIYPNPTSDYIYLEGFNIESISKLRITNTSGKTLNASYIISDERIKINLSTCPKGMYKVGLYFNDRETRYISVMVK